MLKRTALFEEHQKLGGRLIDFGGWELPVQYTGVTEEHLACRNAVGLFDVSHMGEVHVSGEKAEAFLNFLVTNNVSKISVGQAQYTAMCHETGGIVDDLIIYKRAADRFLVVVNASNTDKDFKHIQLIEKKYRAGDSFNPSALIITNESSHYTQIAVQGPHAAKVVQKLTQTGLSPIKNYWFVEGEIQGLPALIARTGYTGEDGFELYVAWEKGPEVWRALLAAGQAEGIKACGLGARDTLRLEMKYPLYGNELSDETNPLEAGLGWVTKLDKDDFVGKGPISEAKAKGLTRQLVGLKLLERGIARHGYRIFSQDGSIELGEVTSGTQSPCSKQSIAVAYVKTGNTQIGTRLSVDIRGQKIPVEVVATPFYKRPY